MRPELRCCRQVILWSDRIPFFSFSFFSSSSSSNTKSEALTVTINNRDRSLLRHSPYVTWEVVKQPARKEPLHRWEMQHGCTHLTYPDKVRGGKNPTNKVQVQNTSTHQYNRTQHVVVFCSKFSRKYWSTNWISIANQVTFSWDICEWVANVTRAAPLVPFAPNLVW